MTDSQHKTENALAEPLTRREREVLGLLAHGLTAPEIAAQLTLAVSSVKWHIQQLYGKLGVNRKQQALSRARALGLLASPAAPELHTRPVRPRHNLHAQVTEFFGREAEVARLREQLSSRRLVTLTGSGGVGKTRLSLRAAEELVDQLADGVWLVQLAPLSDSALVAQTVAVTLGVRDAPGQPALDNLAEALRDRELLLVLDNCEHLLETCAHLAERLLAACPRLRILASSREPLGVGGEAVFPLPSLPFPDPNQLLVIEQLGRYPAVQLFEDRARLVVPNYRVAAHNAAAIARICQRLDGIPLALEMAAARMRAVSADQLAGLLDDAFRVLTGGSRTALPRQQTLRATIDWSYNLLNDKERRLLQRLSVFAGGCTLAAAEAVCADGEPTAAAIQPVEILDLLTALVDKSMVLADRAAGQAMRYRLLETVRQYAREKLNDAGENAHFRTRHRDYFAALVGALDEAIVTERWASAYAGAKAEIENVRQALEWSFADASDLEAAPTVVSQSLVIMPTFRENLSWYRRALAHCETHGLVARHYYASLLESAAHFTALNDPPGALRLAQMAVEVSRQLVATDPALLISSLIGLAWTWMVDLSEPMPAVEALAEAESLLNDRGASIYSAERYREVRANLANHQAELALKAGDYESAQRHSAQVLELIAPGTLPWHAVDARRNMGAAYLVLGDYERARQFFQEAIAVAASIADNEWATNRRALLLLLLGTIALAQGNAAESIDLYKASVRLALELHDNNLLANNIGEAARSYAHLGAAQRAAAFSGASQALYARQGRKPEVDASLDTLFPGWREGPEAAALQAAYAAGQAMTPAEAAAALLEAEV